MCIPWYRKYCYNIHERGITCFGRESQYEQLEYMVNNFNDDTANALVTITCSVYNSTNKVGVHQNAHECHINFTAEIVGPLELTCHVQCTQGVTTFNISWIVIGKYVIT